MGCCNPPGNVASHDLNILLVGPRRTGKSSTGNTLLSRGPVFETRGGEASTIASKITAGCRMNVVDAQGWGLSEESVPDEERSELLRAVSLFGLGGPHAVLLVIPLLDFTEPEGRAVERRMEILTSTVWRHTMVLFTCGDRLRRGGRSVEEHIQSGGPALHWLMEKCRYRYHMFDNTAAVNDRQEVKDRGRKQEGTWQKKIDKVVGRKRRGGEVVGRKESDQVRELLSKVENMLKENGGWHFSLHMYLTLEEDWSRRELELRARQQAETDVGVVRGKQTIYMEQEPRWVTEEEQEDSLRKEQDGKEQHVERKMKRGEDKEQGEKIVLKRMSSEEDSWDMSSDSGVEGESTNMKNRIMAPFLPDGSQKMAFSPIRGLA